MMKTDILKSINPYKVDKRGLNMAFGEYAGILTFGIISTGAIALKPEELPLLIIGAFVISLVLTKLYNIMYLKVEESKFNFVIFAIVGGIIAVVGMKIIMLDEIIQKINGTLWLFMSILIMKFNIDNVLE